MVDLIVAEHHHLKKVDILHAVALQKYHTHKISLLFIASRAGACVCVCVCVSASSTLWKEDDPNTRQKRFIVLIVHISAVEEYITAIKSRARTHHYY